MAKLKAHFSEHQAHSITEFLRVMSNAKRIEMLCLLMRREMCAEELAEAVRLSKSAVFQHLTAMNCVRLLSKRKASRTIYYKLRPETVARVETMQKLFRRRRAINADQ